MLPIKKLTQTALFTALIILGGFIKIPLPNLDYFTLQVIFVLLSGMLLGKKYGFLSVLLFILMGLLGIPVFAAGGGFSYVVKPSFGYLIGFACASFTVALVLEALGKDHLKNYLFAAALGLIVIYTIGLSYKYMIFRFVMHTPLSLKLLLLSMFPIDLPGDILLSIMASIIGFRLRKVH